MNKSIISVVIIIFILLSACQRGSQTQRSIDNRAREEDYQNTNLDNQPEIPISPTAPESETDQKIGKSENSEDFEKDEETEELEKSEELEESDRYIGPAVPNVTSDMQKAVFWLNHYQSPDEIIMTEKDIERFNIENFNILPFLCDFDTLPETVSGNEIKQWVNDLSTIPEPIRYSQEGKKYQYDDYEKLKKNINTEQILGTVNVQYGVTTRRTQMRTWPTYKQSYSSATNQRIDYFTETAVYAAEPVAIYHSSRDGLWYFAEIYNYKGWIPVDDIAICSRHELDNYRSLAPMLVVKAPVMYTPKSEDNRTSDLQLDMGVTLPVLSENSEEYSVSYPVQNKNNGLEFTQMAIPQNGNISVGYLDYTVENVLTQAFKLLGEPYGWGGMNNVRDCSSFIADVYRAFGIIMPRNSNQQEKVSGSVSFSGKSRTERLEMLNGLKPGSALYMPGHAMMYLGKWQERHYIIHDITTVYQKNNEDKLIPIPINQVAVTPLDICNSKGTEYIMLLRTAVVVK